MYGSRRILRYASARQPGGVALAIAELTRKALAIMTTDALQHTAIACIEVNLLMPKKQSLRPNPPPH